MAGYDGFNSVKHIMNKGSVGKRANVSAARLLWVADSKRHSSFDVSRLTRAATAGCLQ